jgi:hypothetical protein
MKRALRMCLLALLGVAASSCGYNAGLRVSEKHESVGLEFFGNETYERDLERPLYDEMSRAIRDLTDITIESPTRAEIVIRGTVKVFQRRNGVRNPENQLLETGIYVSADATLIDRKSGRALGAPAHAGTWVGYVLDQPENEEEARNRVLKHIADQLVLDLFAPVE